jgi:hypothetical protein
MVKSFLSNYSGFPLQKLIFNLLTFNYKSVKNQHLRRDVAVIVVSNKFETSVADSKNELIAKSSENWLRILPNHTATQQRQISIECFRND